MKDSGNSAFDSIQRFIETELRPRVQGDGGDLDLLEIKGNILRVKATNECSRCPLTTNCYKDWLQSRINREFDSSYDIEILIQRPYFWDK